MITILNKTISLFIRLGLLYKRIVQRLPLTNVKKLIDYSYLRYYGVTVNYGKVELFGWPIIQKAQGSSIILEDGIILISSHKFNPAGMGHKVILATLSSDASITIGKNSGLSGSSICSLESIIIGEHCNLGVASKIYDTDFHPVDPIERKEQKKMSDAKSSPVVLESNVWLGANSTILKGVTLKENTVVAVGAVVTKTFGDNLVLAGIPAKVIKQL